MKEEIQLGKWTEEKLVELLRKASTIKNPGDRIDFLSAQFLGTTYKDSTLIGDMHSPELLVINFKGLDCLTFIEYIEAMRRSDSMETFRDNLLRVRYREGLIAFKNRNHFFTDWKAFNSNFVVDVTKSIGGRKTKDVSKRLNERHDGTFFVPGISSRLREITYIPSVAVDDTVTNRFETGDYVGIYSKKDGLDVTHVGIVIRQEKLIYLRHASSLKKNMKVIDEELIGYLASKAGIIIFRPKY